MKDYIGRKSSLKGGKLMPLSKVLIARGVVQFRIDLEILRRSDIVKYKTWPDWHSRVIGEDIIVSDPGEEFVRVTEKFVNAYIFEKKAPPDEIAPAIMNIADDHLSGRGMIIRSGDYISLQNYVRKSGSKK
jgi:hypothetical protein